MLLSGPRDDLVLVWFGFESKVGSLTTSIITLQLGPSSGWLKWLFIQHHTTEAIF